MRINVTLIRGMDPVEAMWRCWATNVGKGGDRVEDDARCADSLWGKETCCTCCPVFNYGSRHSHGKSSTAVLNGRVTSAGEGGDEAGRAAGSGRLHN